MGGGTKDEYPTAILLSSGDVVIMSGASRTCYHGVPRIVPGLPLQSCAHQTYLRTHRININIRQVL